MSCLFSNTTKTHVHNGFPESEMEPEFKMYVCGSVSCPTPFLFLTARKLVAATSYLRREQKLVFKVLLLHYVELTLR